MSYTPTLPEMPPVFLELPEEATAQGALVTGTYLNGGLSAADAALLTVPMPVRSGDPVVRGRINAGLQIGFIVLSIAAGGFLSASQDVPHDVEGDANWAETAAVLSFLLGLALGGLPKLLGRKHRNALKAWIAGVEQTWGLRTMLVPLANIEGDGLRAEIIELGNSLARSREAIMAAAGDRHARQPGDSDLRDALDHLARYATNPTPGHLTRAREAVITYADRADNHNHNPNTPLGETRS